MREHCLPLKGVKVLDLSRVLAGPYASQVLGDLGADIIKVEHPTRGDDTRSWGPPFDTYGESAYYFCANRNKRSIGIDFKTPAGSALVAQLAAKSDVIVENYLPGGLAKYKLDYKSLQNLNRKLVYASITGYGQTGPWSNRPGYDVMVEAEFGLMHITGHPQSPPSKVGVAITDLTAGLYTVVGVLGALRHADLTGEGQHLDVALSDCQLASLANIASNVLVSGQKDTGRQGNGHPSICPYQSFPTSDGSIMIGGGNDRLFGLLANQLGHPEWIQDVRFSTNSNRVKNRSILVALISEITNQKTTKYWETAWSNQGFPYAPVNDIKDSLEHPQTVFRNMVKEIGHAKDKKTKLKLVDHPVKWSKTQPSIRNPPPSLGQHTREILTTELNYSAEQIDAMIDKKVIV